MIASRNRLYLGLLAGLLALGGGAQAQDAPACAATWKAAEAVLATQGLPKRPQISNGWCLVDRVRPVTATGAPQVEIRQLFWRGTALAQGLSQASLPLDARFRAQGVRITPANASGRRAEFDLSLGLARDTATGQLLLEGPLVAFPGGNSVHIEAVFDGIDPQAQSVNALTLGAANLSSMSIGIVSDGRAVDQIMALIGAVDPRGAQRWDRDSRDLALALIAQLPDTLIAPPSRQILERLAKDMPRIKGSVVLLVKAKDGFAMHRLAALFGPGAPDDAAGIARLLDGLTLTVAYDAAP